MVHITTAFFFSSLWHIISIATISEGHISLSRLTWGLTAFFMGQIPAVVAEQALIRRKPAKSSEESKDHKIATRGEDATGSRSFWGYARTFSWLGLTGWLFVNVYRSVGLMETKHPFPVLGPVLSMMGVPVPS